jgi:hypothetical protein
MILPAGLSEACKSPTRSTQSSPSQDHGQQGGGAAADAPSKVLFIASKEAAELKTRQIDRSLSLETLTVLTGPRAGHFCKVPCVRFETRSLLCREGLVEGVVGTPRPLTGL